MKRDAYAGIVGHVVRIHREARGIKLAKMAAAVGLTESAWSRVETGVTTMHVHHLVKAARFLSIAPHVLVRAADGIAASTGT